MVLVSSRVITFRRPTPSWQVLACAISTISHVLPAACYTAPSHTLVSARYRRSTLANNTYFSVRLLSLATCETEMGPYRLLLVFNVGAIVSISDVRCVPTPTNAAITPLLQCISEFNRSFRYVFRVNTLLLSSLPWPLMSPTLPTTTLLSTVLLRILPSKRNYNIPCCRLARRVRFNLHGMLVSLHARALTCRYAVVESLFCCT